MAMIPNDERHILSSRKRPWYTLPLTRRDLYHRISTNERNKKKKKTKDQDKDVGLE